MRQRKMSEMKIKVIMKTPDALGDAIWNAVMEKICDPENIEDADLAELEEENSSEVSDLSEECRKICEKWFEFGEYLTVEIDTDEKTATVCEVKP